MYIGQYYRRLNSDYFLRSYGDVLTTCWGRSHNITMTNDQCLLLDHGVSNFKLGHVLKVYIASSFPVSTKSKSRNLHCNVLTLPVPFSDKESKLT